MRKEKRNTPRGPATVIIFLTTGLYDVAVLSVLGSPTTTSTPGGIESGVLPSFDPRACVVEKCRRAEGNRPAAAMADDAGTSAGSEHGEAAADKARLSALPGRGARIAAIGFGEAGPGPSAGGWRSNRDWLWSFEMVMAMALELGLNFLLSQQTGARHVYTLYMYLALQLHFLVA